MNLVSSSENNNQNNYIFNSINYNNIEKIPFNQTNYSRYNYQSQNDNTNTRYINVKRAFDEKFRKKKSVYKKDMDNELNVQYFSLFYYMHIFKFTIFFIISSTNKPRI